MITTERRAASVIADKLSECLVVLRDQFKKCLAAHTERQLSIMVEQAKKSSYLFSNVGYNINIDKFIRQLFNRFSRITVDTDTMLQVQGKKVKVVTLLIKGHCREFMTLGHGHDRIGLISEFDHSAQNAIGAEYVVQNKKCKTSVVCTTQCELLVISGAQFNKSITDNMREQINQIGDQKASFIRQRIASFQSIKPDLSNISNFTEVQRENLYSLRSRHGKWDEQEIKYIDDMLTRNSMIEEEDHESDEESSDDAQRPRYDGIGAMEPQPKHHEKHTLVSVPSIERIAIRIRPLPQKVKRQRLLKTRASIKRAESLPSLSQLRQEQNLKNHQIAMDLVSEKTKREHGKRLSRFNDLMPSNFYNVSDSKQTQQYLYGRLLRALQKKQIEKKRKKPKVAKINMHLTAKNSMKTGSHLFGALTPKSPCPSMRKHCSLPLISARKQSVPQSSAVKPRKLRSRTMRKRRSRKRHSRHSRGKVRKSSTKVKGKREGRRSNLEQIDEQIQRTHDQSHRTNEIDFDGFRHWIDHKTLNSEIRHLQQRHNIHLVTSYDELIQKLSRTGACVDHLVKYHPNTNPELYKTHSNKKW